MLWRRTSPLTPAWCRATMIARRDRRRSHMNDTFFNECDLDTVERVGDLVKSILCLENTGSITDDDANECFYYLRKISEITGVSVDFNEFNDQYYEEE